MESNSSVDTFVIMFLNIGVTLAILAGLWLYDEWREREELKSRRNKFS